LRLIGQKKQIFAAFRWVAPDQSSSLFYEGMAILIGLNEGNVSNPQEDARNDAAPHQGLAALTFAVFSFSTNFSKSLVNLLNFTP
jgi:hypothetical protein